MPFINHTAICNPVCLNGGRCDGPNQCTCTAEYTGSQCGEGKLDHSITRYVVILIYLSTLMYQSAVCFPPDGCQNGVCVRPSLCACQAYWTGRRCEDRMPINFRY